MMPKSIQLDQMVSYHFHYIVRIRQWEKKFFAFIQQLSIATFSPLNDILPTDLIKSWHTIIISLTYESRSISINFLFVLGKLFFLAFDFYTLLIALQFKVILIFIFFFGTIKKKIPL